jgi:hypothetical protein
MQLKFFPARKLQCNVKVHREYIIMTKTAGEKTREKNKANNVEE